MSLLSLLLRSAGGCRWSACGVFCVGKYRRSSVKPWVYRKRAGFLKLQSQLPPQRQRQLRSRLSAKNSNSCSVRKVFIIFAVAALFAAAGLAPVLFVAIVPRSSSALFGGILRGLVVALIARVLQQSVWKGRTLRYLTVRAKSGASEARPCGGKCAAAAPPAVCAFCWVHVFAALDDAGAAFHLGRVLCAPVSLPPLCQPAYRKRCALAAARWHLCRRTTTITRTNTHTVPITTQQNRVAVISSSAGLETVAVRCTLRPDSVATVCTPLWLLFLVDFGIALFVNLPPPKCQMAWLIHQRELKGLPPTGKQKHAAAEAVIVSSCGGTPQTADILAVVAAAASEATARAFEAAPRSVALYPDFTFIENILERSRFRRSLVDLTSGGIFWNAFENFARDPDTFRLTSGGARMLHTPNAGGNSIWSEVVSYEIFARVLGAKLLRTETEIEYNFEGKITDYAMAVEGHHIGVSVTRLIDFRDIENYRYTPELTQAEVKRLLCKKLFGVNASSKIVTKKHRWEKQILHVLTTSRSAAREVFLQYWQMPQQLRANTCVVVTQCTRANWLFV
eukprot:TRINITY_DN4964_c0_g1_i2.p1 TRINITY_DN4964_c0_g1~~TRINITY_DN4964_c0_g1_i2.p1  ORF type:complete len:564 (-),score=94.09 TRINITY_DN4964_c0_g1_i2:45-1736(-)